jgi:hypothetical protein
MRKPARARERRRRTIVAVPWPSDMHDTEPRSAFARLCLAGDCAAARCSALLEAAQCLWPRAGRRRLPRPSRGPASHRERPADRRSCRTSPRSPRHEGIAAVVSFAPGEVPTLPALHVAGQHVTAWQPFGMRWPDGSLRQALCLFVDRAAGRLGERAGAAATGPGPGPAGRRLRGADARRNPRSRGRHGRTASPCAPNRYAVRRRSKRTRCAASNCAARGSATPASLAELHVIAWRDQPHADVELAVWCSDPRTAG